MLFIESFFGEMVRQSREINPKRPHCFLKRLLLDIQIQYEAGTSPGEKPLVRCSKKSSNTKTAFISVFLG